MIKKKFAVLIFTLNAACISSAQANDVEDKATFQTIFTEWTKAFNDKKFPEVCGLFSRSVIAAYQGAPAKDYAALCNGFEKIFQQAGFVYHNDFRIHQIYRSNDQAAVRITWYLDVYEKGVHLSSIQEEGLDIFQKRESGKWEIVNFIAYPVPPEK